MENLLEGPMGATTLAARLGVSKATAFRLARTMQTAGYVVQLEDSRYTLGPRCLMLAALAFGRVDIRRELRWATEELQERTGETAFLTVLAGREAAVIDSIPSKQSVVSTATVGEVYPVHASSAGLAFLAADPDFMEVYLQGELSAPTKHTVTDPEKVRALVEDVKVKGYALNHSYWRDGVFAVSACVRDAAAKPIAALGIMMPEFRLEHSSPDELGKLVADITTRASERFGFGGPANPPIQNDR